jgi:hypothetical protein
METSTSYRPRVSRETRLLLTAGAIAVAALWLLAQVRFPERPVTANPVTSVLSQLSGGQKYEDLAGETAELHARLEPALLALDAATVGAASPTSTRAAAIRLRDDLAVTWLAPGSALQPGQGVSVIARDAASGIAVARVPGLMTGAPLVPWTPRQLQRPRYLTATDLSPAGVSLRPVFLGALDPIDSALWPDAIWAIPARADVETGSFLFTGDAVLAGLVIRYRGALAVVPGETILAEAERLLAVPPRDAGAIGVEVQELTPALAQAAGASAGVIISWVDRAGAAGSALAAGDVIESVNGQPLSSRQQWDARAARLAAGETLNLRVRRGGVIRELALVANPVAPPPEYKTPGLTLRSRTRIGAEVARIAPGSAGDRAGLRVGDLITLAGDVAAPTAAQVLRGFGGKKPGERLLLAVTRGDAHFLTTLER